MSAGGGHVKVIAGEFNGVKGPAHTLTPVELWDVELDKKGTPYELQVPPGHNCIVFVRRGRVHQCGFLRPTSCRCPRGALFSGHTLSPVRPLCATDCFSRL
eukprot:6405411-Pyramimonas_sp.AAC.1